ncbi:MAG: phosphopantothenoylcysteine decarboxylase [Opitutales bacterium]|nr:phosphopantothenoylcysteine decarboxylase [Opitutales bacterium]
MEIHQSLADKRIVLGVTGSIAAYKAADITSQLVKLGAHVRVIMTESAAKFITPLTLQTLSRNRVYTSMWDAVDNWEPDHIDLADHSDLLLVAPATAQTIANFAHGNAPDLLSNTYLATRAPVMIAPAMNGKMLEHPATRSNIDTLRGRGVQFVDPVEGMLACGYVGNGKLASVETICENVREFLM